MNAGYFDTCGVTTDNRAYCWGKNGPELGSVSPGDYDFERVPRLVAGGLEFLTVDPSYAHTCGVTTGDVTSCWGALGNLAESPTPVRVLGGLRFQQHHRLPEFYLAGFTPTGRAEDHLLGFVSLRECEVILPWIDGPDDVYSAVSSAFDVDNFTATVVPYDWPLRPEMLIDFDPTCRSAR